MEDGPNNEEKIEVDPRLLVLLELGEDEEFDEDEQSFMLGLLEENGLITHDLKLTQAGIRAYEKEIKDSKEENDE